MPFLTKDSHQQQSICSVQFRVIGDLNSGPKSGRTELNKCRGEKN